MKTIRAYTVMALVYCGVFFILPAQGGHEEPRLIILGDSLSTTHESWPNLLRDRNETVIYILGGNDILQLNSPGHARYRMQSHVAFLLERNFKVLLIIPPTFDIDEAKYGASIASHRALSMKMATAINWVLALNIY